MIVRRLDDVEGSAREVSAANWISRRLLLAHERMGFSVHDTIIHAGTSTQMHYQHHLEAVYCIAGAGTLVDLATGDQHRIEPGTIYALDEHDRHVLQADSTMRMVCVFNPPLTGREVHDASGAYPPPTAPARGDAQTSDHAHPAPEHFSSRLPAGSIERFIPRGVPTVWTRDASNSPLDSAELTRFEQQGYLCWPEFLAADEVQALRDELETQLAAVRRDDPRVIFEPGNDAVVRSIFAVHQTSERFAAIARHPRLLDIARQVLDDDVYLHQTRLNLKPGFEGQPFWWHSDFETWHHEDGMPTMRCFSCVIALSEITDYNGPLLLLPGSHQVFVGCVGETPPQNYGTSLRQQTVGVPSNHVIGMLVERHGLVAPKGPAGSVILFDCNLMHGSAGNLTPWPRHHLFIVYNAVSNRLGPPVSGLPPRPEHIATRATFEPLIARSPT